MFDNHICGDKGEMIVGERKTLYIAYENVFNSSVFTHRCRIRINSYNIGSKVDELTFGIDSPFWKHLMAAPNVEPHSLWRDELAKFYQRTADQDKDLAAGHRAMAKK